MKRLLILTGMFLTFGCSSPPETSSSNTIKALLIQNLKNSHSNEYWYATTQRAVADLSLEQLNWQDTTGNNSIGGIISHMAFWNERVLRAFKGDTIPDFKQDNKITFQQFNEQNWDKAIEKYDSVHTAWIEAVEQATDEQLENWGSEINDMCAHAAYHTGQIVYIRKQNGWWN